ncbi:MAG: cupin domain-containing protein, partial [Clostridia bacterium]
RDKEPMLVTISPDEKKPQLVSHSGQEFNYVISGKIRIVIGAKELILSDGDSVYFDPSVPHGQFAVDGEAKFLTIIDKE